MFARTQAIGFSMNPWMRWPVEGKVECEKFIGAQNVLRRCIHASPTQGPQAARPVIVLGESSSRSL